MSLPPLPDPRPHVRDGALAILECSECEWRSAVDAPRCPRCGGRLQAATVPATGTVWSSTVVRIGTPGRQPPYGLTYVDVDRQIRVLAHTEEPTRIPVGTTVALSHVDGDLLARTVATTEVRR